jgi:excinuclease ABC subunit C
MKKPEFLPDGPGVYLFKNRDDHIIYVGKASSVKKRVSQYFQSTDMDPKTRALVKNIADIEYLVTPSEIDALILESNLIKEHRPRYNIDMKDDKQYPFIKITVNEDFPRIFITRRRLRDGARYFGPYTNAGSVRESLKIISQLFRIRQCKRMQEHISKQNFEAAATLRDQLQAIELLSRRQQVTGGFDDWDAISIAISGDNASAQVLYIRNGSLVGRAEFTLNSQNASESEIMGAFLKQYYSDAPVPGEVLLDTMPDDPAILEWLRGVAGKVDIIVPSRGRKKELVDMAFRNARSHLKMVLLNDEKKEKSGYGALVEIQDILGLDSLPERVEAFDISNTGGTDAVGSMVVFTNGRPDLRRYRHFNIRTVKGINDPAMMEEVVSRRLKRIGSGEDTVPGLIVVDGGVTQLGAALSAMEQTGIHVPVIGLAKQFEHIYIPDTDAPLILPETSPALKMLKTIRDESHRFAISHHRRRRTSRLRTSVLDTIPGIGKKRKEILLRHFGSLDGIKNAGKDELENVPGISKVIAKTIFSKLHAPKAYKL